MLSRGKVQLPYCTRPADTQVMESDWKGYEEHDTRVICTCKERVVITHNHMPARMVCSPRRASMTRAPC